MYFMKCFLALCAFGLAVPSAAGEPVALFSELT